MKNPEEQPDKSDDIPCFESSMKWVLDPIGPDCEILWIDTSQWRVRYYAIEDDDGLPLGVGNN